MKDASQHNRMTGTELLECFKQRYGPPDTIAKVNEKKKRFHDRTDNFRPNHHISPVLEQQIKHAMHLLNGKKPSANDRSSKSLLNQLDAEYWRNCIDGLESRLAIRLDVDVHN